MNFKSQLLFSVFVFISCTFSGAKTQATTDTIPIQNAMEITTYPELCTKDFVMGHFTPATHPDFALVDPKYADREGLYLHKDCYSRFVEMWKAAKKDDIVLTIKSASRNFEYQKGIWERKWKGETPLEEGLKASNISNKEKRALKILLYSSMPGSSRHHWGSDMDLNSFSNSYFETGKGKKEYDWLVANAHNYGFCQPYTNKQTNRTGYEEEKWHWSFMPISAVLTEWASENITNDMIFGFDGAETAVEIDIVTNYILGINTLCIKE